MTDKTYINDFFHAALDYELNHKWKGRQKALAIDVGVSSSFITELKKRRSDTTIDVKELIARACGYSFEQFINKGRIIIEQGERAFEELESSKLPIAALDPAIEILQEFLEEEGQEIVMEKAGPLIQIIREMITEKTPNHEAFTLLAKLEKLSTKEFYRIFGDIKETVNDLEKKQKDLKASGNK